LGENNGANAAAAVRRTTANPFMQKANQATNGQAADAERRVTAFIQRRIDKLLICLKIHQYKFRNIWALEFTAVMQRDSKLFCFQL
jgi:hypothetical protein